MLTGGEVRVWRVHLDALDARDLAAPSSAEAAHAAKICDEARRAHYLKSRQALRTILAAVTGAPIEFALGVHGKPRLPAAPRVRFNLSRSGAMALVAVALDTEVGVDVECIRPMPDSGAIAERFFPPSEAAAFAAAPAEQRERDFFRCWTRIEAILKAQGLGLHGAGAESPNSWAVQEVDSGEGYAAAVAAEGQSLLVGVREFRGA